MTVHFKVNGHFDYIGGFLCAIYDRYGVVNFWFERSTFQYELLYSSKFQGDIKYFAHGAIFGIAFAKDMGRNGAGQPKFQTEEANWQRWRELIV